MKFRIKRVVCAFLAVVYSSGSLIACGISWNKPEFHFDSVNEWGYMSYWEEIGRVGMGDQQIPLFINFLSSKQTSSPYLGYGWTLALLESRVEQIAENEFRIWQPSGKYRTFRRDKDNPNLLKGSGGWLAEISNDQITAKANCGWGLTFKNGKISSMSTPEGKTYDYRYEGGKVKSIQEVGSSNTVLEVVENPVKRSVITLMLGDQEIVLELGKKPRIEQINGQNLVGGMDSSLSRIVKVDGSERTLLYEVEPNNVVPSLQPREGRILTWKPTTGIVGRDTDWKYEIQQDEKHVWNNAAMTRVNSKNEKEFWHRDIRTRREITQTRDGAKVIKEWFRSGLLTGSLRKIETSVNGKTTTDYRTVYNDKGKLVRSEGVANGVREYQYDENGRRISEMRNGKEVWKRVYKGKNRDSYTTIFPNGEKIQYAANSSDEFARISSEVSKELPKKLPAASYLEVHINGASERIVLYSNMGKSLAEIIDGKQLMEFVYSQSGKLEEIVRNGSTWMRHEYDDTGRLMAKKEYTVDGDLRFAQTFEYVGRKLKNIYNRNVIKSETTLVKLN